MLGNTLEDIKRKDISCLTTCRSKGGGVSIDLDAQNVIEAIENTGITLSPTQISACNELINDYKSYGLWNKRRALYGRMGGTSAAHKFNWKDPRDLDAAFRLQFFGGWTHSVNGSKPNGVNAYADTFFKLGNFTSIENSSVGIYIRENSDISSVELGAGYVSFGIEGVCVYSRTSNSFLGCCNGSSFNSASNTDSRGLYTVARQGTTQYIRKRGSSTINNSIVNTSTIGTYSNLSIYLGAANERHYGAMIFSSREQTVAFIGDYVTEAESNNEYTAIQKFETALNRQV